MNVPGLKFAIYEADKNMVEGLSIPVYPLITYYPKNKFRGYESDEGRIQPKLWH